MIVGALAVSGMALLMGTDSLATWMTTRPKGKFPVSKTNAEWKQQLTPAAYHVLREGGTEPAFTSPLNDEHRKGVFRCAGCGNDLYSSEQKFNSGTGWPSFWAPIDDGAVKTQPDTRLIVPRIEVLCADCGGHLGHVFDDGPKPTGKRYCMNGVAMTFMPAE
jgi:peptide-methionine (R)-S-oxide reductase